MSVVAVFLFVTVVKEETALKSYCISKCAAECFKRPNATSPKPIYCTKFRHSTKRSVWFRNEYEYLWVFLPCFVFVNGEHVKPSTEGSLNEGSRQPIQLWSINSVQLSIYDTPCGANTRRVCVIWFMIFWIYNQALCCWLFVCFLLLDLISYRRLSCFCWYFLLETLNITDHSWWRNVIPEHSTHPQHAKYLSALETCWFPLFKWANQPPDESTVVAEKGMKVSEG